MEQWKTIVGFPEYEVSDKGRVRSNSTTVKKKAKDGILRCSPNVHGYPSANLWAGGKAHYRTVHRLVADAFIPRVDGKNLIDHINRDKTDNCVENLRWVNHKENANNSDRNVVYPHLRQCWIVQMSPTAPRKYFTSEEEAKNYITLSGPAPTYTAE